MKVREIADHLGAEFVGDGEVEITGIAEVGRANAGKLAFIDNVTSSVETNASCLIVPKNCELDTKASLIFVDLPKLAFAKAASRLVGIVKPSGRHSMAVFGEGAAVSASYIGAFVSVGEDSKVGEGTELHNGVRIGRFVSIGANSVLYPNCVVYDGAVIGDKCILHAGAVVGADGFGYVREITGEHIKFPQTGTVVIENNVEIGANTCIDRGSLGETRIGEGTKIDNLVQIAHNVRIGKNCIIVSLSGISGSSVLEDDVVLAGQVGIADHVILRSGVTIGAKSAVFPNKIVTAGVWSGIPVQRVDDYKKQQAILRNIGLLKDRVKEIEKRLK